jgi:hypothetical protein
MRHGARRRAGRAFLWLAVAIGSILSVFAAVAAFWMMFAPFFETHRTLIALALAGIPVLAGSLWAGCGVITLAEILRETRNPQTDREDREGEPRA